MRRRLPIVAIALLVFASLVVPFAARHGSDRLAVAMAVVSSDWSVATTYEIDGTDPWGHRLVGVPAPGGLPRIYSCGPNGRDDHQLGDDVVPSDPERALAGALWRSPIAFICAALIVAWSAWGPFRKTPRGSLPREAARAFVLALGPIVLGYGMVVPLGIGPIYDAYLSRLWAAPGSLVPIDVAVAITWIIVPWVVAFAWRLRREPAAESVTTDEPDAVLGVGERKPTRVDRTRE